MLKALAFGDRAEPKDAYDLVYVLRSTPDVPGSVADRLAEHAQHHDAIVRRALELLQRDFADIDGLGPRRTASFEFLEPEEQDAATADAHGHVNDLLRACQARDLVA